MHVRRRIVVVLALVGVTGLLTVFLWPLSTPFEGRLVGVERSGVLDDTGNEELLVALSISNRDRVSVMFDSNRAFEAKVANHWIQVDQPFRVARLAPGQQASVLLHMPAGADACRLRLNYQSEIWKQRFVQAIGLRGRTLVAKSPLLCKWVWPDDLRTMRVPPHWKQTTLEVVFPQRCAKSAESPGRAHNNRRQRTPRVHLVCISRQWRGASAADR